MNVDDEFDEPPALTVEEYAQVKALFARGMFEIELAGEDLALNACCVPEVEDLNLFPSAKRVYSVNEIARVKLKQVIASSVSLAIDDFEKDSEASRTALFAVAGRLRELAALVEKEAAALGKTDWNKYEVATIEPETVG